MSLFCSVCSISYDYVLKFEQLEVEETLFLAARNLTTRLERKWMNHNPPATTTASESDPDKLVKLYFSQLSDEDVVALYKVYETDFRMFNYTFEYKNFKFPENP
jgi:hypothetical protein